MSTASNFSFYFGLRLSWSLGNNNKDEAHSQGERGANKTSPLISQNIDFKQASLSPAAQKMQRQIREREQGRQEMEREVDAESLYLLEAATAADSKEAKERDKESLKVLIRCTNQMKKPKSAFKTPLQTSFWPPRYIKGLNGTPLSYEPSFSTSSAVYRNEVPSTGNEFEDFLIKDGSSRASSHMNGSKPQENRRNSFSSLLASVKSWNPSVCTPAIGPSEHITREAHSVFALMEKVEEKDADDELALMKDIDEAMESPIESPTPFIKHLPKSGDASVKGSSRKEDSAEDVQSDTPAWTPESEADTEGSIQAGIATPGSEGRSRDEEWEVV